MTSVAFKCPKHGTDLNTAGQCQSCLNESYQQPTQQEGQERYKVLPAYDAGIEIKTFCIGDEEYEHHDLIDLRVPKHVAELLCKALNQSPKPDSVSGECPCCGFPGGDADAWQEMLAARLSEKLKSALANKEHNPND